MADVPNLDPPAVDPADEVCHVPGAHEWWNESWYADVAAIDGSHGAWLRFGLYPNRSQTWFHLVVARRGEPVLIVHDLKAPLAEGARQSLSTDTWRCEITAVEPLRRWRVRASATAQAYADPAAVYRGEQGEPTQVEVDLTWHSEDRPYHYGITTRYEISARVTGSIRVGDDVISVDGPGQRDHSWAVRDWWAFEWCWSAGGLDDGTRFHLSDIRLADAAVGFGYLIDPAAGWVPARRIEADEDVDDLGLPLVARLRIEPFGTGERGDEAAGSLAITAEPIAVSPLLFVADDGRESRFPRVLCRYTTADGRSGAGWTEWNQPLGKEG